MSTEPYAQHKPHKGDPISLEGKQVGTVTAIAADLCFYTTTTGHNSIFIWRHPEGLNTEFSWPAKTAPREG